MDTSGTGMGYLINYEDKSIDSKTRNNAKTNWPYTLQVIQIHLCGLYGLKLFLCGQFSLYTFFYSFTMGQLAGLGVTAGAHRLFCHKAFKANFPLRIIFTLLYNISMIGPLWLWVALHRVHHKYSDTEKDPHNVNRGFWYSHIGWLLNFDFNTFLNDAKTIDMKDIEADPVIMWTSRYFYPLMVFVLYPVSALIPWMFWGETLETSIFLGTSLRQLVIVHAIFSVNSFAHTYGNKPFDSSIFPSQNFLVTILAMGEGWHNYHHAFPYDYRASELGAYNPATAFIDFFARVGWAYDLKAVSKEMILQRAQRTGDGSYVNKFAKPTLKESTPIARRSSEQGKEIKTLLDKNFLTEDVIPAELFYPCKDI